VEPNHSTPKSLALYKLLYTFWSVCVSFFSRSNPIKMNILLYMLKVFFSFVI
jgi:hypothetical protein